MTKQNNNSPIEWVVAIILGIILVASIPILSDLVGKIVGTILTILFLGIVIGLIILALWYFFFREEYGGY